MHNLQQADTVPCKCKLTVPRNSNFETRSSILETRKLRVSRLESSASSIESSASSFETAKQRTFRVISFSHVLSEASVRFLFTGINSAETANCVCVFVGAMCSSVCSSWKRFALQAFSWFLADNNRTYCAFLIKKMLFSKFWFENLK